MAASKRKPTPLRSTGRTEAPSMGYPPNLTTPEILNLSLDYYLRRCYIASQPRSSKGVLWRHPEDGARRGVLRRRLWNRCPGRHGTPPAGHYDPDARSSLTDPDASPVRQARDRSLKPPRWSAGRRASRVMGRKAPRKAPGLPRQVQAHGCLASTRTSLGAPPPLSPGERSKRKKPRAQKTRRGNGKVLFDESSFSSSFRPSPDSGEGRNP